jgi:hypothetical protein
MDVLMPHWSAGMASDRSLQFFPFLAGALLLGTIAFQARLLPSRQAIMEIPSTLGVPAGAAPQQSAAARNLEPASIPPSPVLPSESMAADTPPNASELGVPAAPERRIPLTGEAGPGSWTDHLPQASAAAGGAGNIRLQTKQPTALSTLVANLVQSVRRLHAAATPPIRPARGLQSVNKTAQGPAKPKMPVTMPPTIGVARGGLGGPTPVRPVLGGPHPLAANYAPSINGTGLRRSN